LHGRYARGVRSANGQPKFAFGVESGPNGAGGEAQPPTLSSSQPSSQPQRRRHPAFGRKRRLLNQVPSRRAARLSIFAAAGLCVRANRFRALQTWCLSGSTVPPRFAHWPLALRNKPCKWPMKPALISSCRSIIKLFTNRSLLEIEPVSAPPTGKIARRDRRPSVLERTGSQILLPALKFQPAPWGAGFCTSHLVKIPVCPRHLTCGFRRVVQRARTWHLADRGRGACH
jgi:hypothetical protein